MVAEGAANEAMLAGEESAAMHAAISRAAAACAAACTRLREHSIAPEAFASYVPPRRRFLITSAATMRPLGEVWRIASLLLDTTGGLHALGTATRSAERGRPGYQSVSKEERREIAAAALKGGYPIGTPVNFDTVPLPLEATTLTDPAAPIGYADGEVRVRWRAGAPLTGAPTLADFLRDRVGLLLAPLG